MLAQALLDALIDRALAEDVGAGDLTTLLTVDPSVHARAIAVARSPLVVCGGAVFARVFERIDPSSRTALTKPDGAVIEKGEVLWTAHGPARALLQGERTALNFVQRMSGIATLARAYVLALPRESKARIADTRKTTPGLRSLERYAVTVGGAHNHRNDLSSAVLIKDNHIVAAGGIEAALERARARAPHTCRIEIEVQTLSEFDRAIACRPDIILLDNFELADLREAVVRNAGRVLLEASGGVTLARIPEIAETGVDVISVGALTHSPQAANIALDLEIVR